jgi:hypothetical protein
MADVKSNVGREYQAVVDERKNPPSKAQQQQTRKEGRKEYGAYMKRYRKPATRK